MNYRVKTFPQPCRVAHIAEKDLCGFTSIDLDRINGGSHITQLVENAHTVGLATMQVYPEHEEVHVTFLEVLKSMRGNNLNSVLLRGVFDFSASMATNLEKHVWITVGGFTDKGQRSVLPTFRKLSVEYNGRGVTFDYNP